MNPVARYKDIVAATSFLVFSVAMYYGTGNIRIIAPNSASYINAQFYPYVLSILLGLASVVEFVSAVRNLPAGDASAGERMSRAGVIRLLLTLLLLVVYVALLDALGFLIMTAVYVFLQAIVLTPRNQINVPAALVLAIVSSGLIYVLFTHVLTMVLPRAPFLPF